MSSNPNDYSGVIINQNAASTATYDWRTLLGGNWVYQTFALPANYRRGSVEGEQRIPDLSGIQVFVEIDSMAQDEASIDYRLDYYGDDSLGWVGLTSGSVVGAPVDGTLWFDLIFPEPLSISQSILKSEFRFGIKTDDSFGVNAFHIVSPTPLIEHGETQGMLYGTDGFTPLIPGQTASLNFRILAMVADDGINFLNNEYRSVVISAAPANVDSASASDAYWLSPPLPSRFAVQSLYFNVQSANDSAVVVDGVMIDPLTPNMACNVYYSMDDTNTGDSMTEDDWEGKLWTRVPQVYLPSQRMQYVFPSPILAKYMKLEFSNLQAQSYDPGNFQKTVQYKKFPTWVANFFIAQMELPQFTVTHVDVVYDALRFAYDYYLDDLSQAPQSPTAPPANFVPQLTSYFKANADQDVDQATLAKVNLIMNIFANPTTTIDQTSILGQFVINTANSSSAPPVQPETSTLQPVDRTTVSSLAREPLLFEQSLPAMYFFIPCRHGYKEVSATFEYNRAYFAGVKDVAWIRNNYTIATDTPLYIESGADRANTEFSDWVFEGEDLNWYVY